MYDNCGMHGGKWLTNDVGGDNSVTLRRGAAQSLGKEPMCLATVACTEESSLIADGVGDSTSHVAGQRWCGVQWVAVQERIAV